MPSVLMASNVEIFVKMHNYNDTAISAPMANTAANTKTGTQNVPFLLLFSSIFITSERIIPYLFNSCKSEISVLK